MRFVIKTSYQPQYTVIKNHRTRTLRSQHGMLDHPKRIQLNHGLLALLLAVLLLFVFAEQQSLTHAISHLSDEINHSLKHDKTGQNDLCEECLCLDNLSDTLLPAQALLLDSPEMVTDVVTSPPTFYSKLFYHHYAARAPPLFV